MITPIHAPPAPRSASELQRVQHTRLRRQVLYGMHERQVQDRIEQALGTTRANAVRIVDMTANPAWYVCSQLAALYREIPEISPPEGGEDCASAILEAGWWQLAARNQRDVIGLNDGFIRVDIDPETRDPSFRLVPPDLVEVVASPIRPAQPLAMKEWIVDPEDPSKWVQLVTDPRSRTYLALDDKGVDVSARVLEGTFTGEAYPFIVDNKPVLPYVGYHAAESGYCLDPYSGREVFDGAIQLGMYYSFFGHALRQASWAQRYAVGVRPVGGDVDESGRRKDVVADPASVALFEPSDDAGGGSPSVSQWAAPVDPDKFFSAIERYERRLVESALSQVGVSRRESDIRSSMALAVSREAQRDAQRAYEPVFRRSDLRLLKLVAGLRGDPTEGWRINYRSIPRDSSELAAELALMQGQIASGLLDVVSAYKVLHPGLSDVEAEAAVQRITETNARFAGGNLVAR